MCERSKGRTAKDGNVDLCSELVGTVVQAGQERGRAACMCVVCALVSLKEELLQRPMNDHLCIRIDPQKRELCVSLTLDISSGTTLMRLRSRDQRNDFTDEVAA